MARRTMLSGWCYTSEGIRKAQNTIKELNLNIAIEENYSERIAYAIGDEKEIEILFEACRK